MHCGVYIGKLTDFYDVMPQSQRAIRQRYITSGHVTRLEEMRLAVVSHVIEADDGPRDHVSDDDNDENEQIFQHVTVPQQNTLRLARLKLGQHPASRTADSS